MQRQHSISSATDSGLSSYCESSSGSPIMLTPCASPHPGRTSTHTKVSSMSYLSHSTPSFDGFRCSSCLDRGEHVPVEPGQPCLVCDTISPEQRPAGKAPRRKRIDRHRYSRLAAPNNKTQAMTKDQGEGGRRFDHTSLIGIHQEMLLRVNPNLITSARTGNGRKKIGWKPLNQNNVCQDVVNPLKHNKSDIYISTTQVQEDSDRIFVNIRDELIAPLQSEATRLSQSKPPYSELLKFIEQMSQAKWIERVEASCNTRGGHDFRVPFGAEAKH
jgi:hypothetical protein